MSYLVVILLICLSYFSLVFNIFVETTKHCYSGLFDEQNILKNLV